MGHSFFTFWQVIAVSAEYDLIIKHGSLLDTASGYNQSTQDIRISDGRIHAIRDEIYEEDAETVVDASSTIICTGLIDLHVHVWDGVAHLAVPADPNCVARE